MLALGARRGRRIGITTLGGAPVALEEARMAFTYDIRADGPRNRLYLRMAGFMTDDDALRVADAIIAEIQKLGPGFAVINDIRELKPTSQTASDHLRRAQEASVKRGSGRVIRVVGDQVVTQMQWNRTLRAARGSGAEIAATVEEAERML
jgi:hypothetical protein